MKLFLDDFRKPSDCISYMSAVIGFKASIYGDNDWLIVKNYNEFVKVISEMNFSHISFDHDLAEEHYQTQDETQYKEKTGLDCAKWFKKFYEESNRPFPKIFVHSMNPIGAEKIKQLFLK